MLRGRQQAACGIERSGIGLTGDIYFYRLPAIRITLAGRCLRTGHGVVVKLLASAGIRRGGRATY